MIDGATLDESAIESAKSKRPQMDVLLERGAITSAQRDEVLIEQARRRVHHLFTLPPATARTIRRGSKIWVIRFRMSGRTLTFNHLAFVVV